MHTNSSCPTPPPSVSIDRDAHLTTHATEAGAEAEAEAEADPSSLRQHRLRCDMTASVCLEGGGGPEWLRRQSRRRSVRRRARSPGMP
eukprot:1644944-Rhodomonas_salina.1